jgi:hypothetical protein
LKDFLIWLLKVLIGPISSVSVSHFQKVLVLVSSFDGSRDMNFFLPENCMFFRKFSPILLYIPICLKGTK